MSTISNRSLSKNGCPYCSNTTVLPGFNDLATVNPDLALQCDGSWDPTTLTQSSGRKVGWVCTKDKNHIWQATVSDRKKGHTCPVCLGRKIMYGYNDLATTHPDFAKESDGSWEPSKVIATANRTVNWVCRFDSHHKWRTTIRKRVSGLGCPVCTSRILVPGVNDLATLIPDIPQNTKENGQRFYLKGFFMQIVDVKK